MTPRQRLARLLRRAAARLDDRRTPPHNVTPLTVVPGGYAEGRADLALTHGRRDPGRC